MLVFPGTAACMSLLRGVTRMICIDSMPTATAAAVHVSVNAGLQPREAHCHSQARCCPTATPDAQATEQAAGMATRTGGGVALSSSAAVRIKGAETCPPSSVFDAGSCVTTSGAAAPAALYAGHAGCAAPASVPAGVAAAGAFSNGDRGAAAVDLKKQAGEPPSPLSFAFAAPQACAGPDAGTRSAGPGRLSHDAGIRSQRGHRLSTTKGQGTVVFPAHWLESRPHRPEGVLRLLSHSLQRIRSCSTCRQLCTHHAMRVSAPARV